MRAMNVGFKYLDTFLSKRKFFRQNPEIRHRALDACLKEIWNEHIREVYTEIPAHERNEAFRKEFAGVDDTVLMAFFFNLFTKFSQIHDDDTKLLNNLNPFITARIDVKLTTKTGDFQILSLSDDKADISKPPWFQKNGIGYVIQSHAGNLKIVAKAAINGKVEILLRGVSVPSSQDKSKRIPYWIDYTKLIVNGKTILNKTTPAWHDKFYLYNAAVKADEEIKIEVEWLPHRSDN